MPAGVCAVVKSKPRRVQRCVSNGSLDVKGSVVVERVWLTDGDGLPTDHLPITTDTGCLGSRKNHLWSLYTNLSSAQQCMKCEKRILTRRAAYKCTVCKKLSHLKCAVNDRPVATRTRSKLKCPEQKQNVTTKTREMRGAQLVQDGSHREVASEDGGELVYGQDKENFHVEETESLTEFIMEENNCKANISTQTHNTTVQSQARQTLSNVRTNIVRRCRSIKKKVEKLRDKLNCDCEDKDNKGVDSNQDIVTGLDCEDSDEAGITAQEAWICSPVRKRLRSRLQEEEDNQSEDRKADWLSFRKNSRKKRKFDGYAVELTDMNDRLEVVEKKINELERTIPQEIEEWRKLQKKYQITDRHGNINTDTVEASDMHETEVKQPLPEDNLQPSAPEMSSDENDIVPARNYGYKSEMNRHDKNWDDTQARAIPPRLLIGENRDCSGSYSEIQQTSTPVTNKEISFRSATQKYQLSQITHKNVTQIKVGKEVSNKENSETQNIQTKSETMTDPESQAEKKILSPNQLAVKSFLERRRSSKGEIRNRSSTDNTKSNRNSGENMELETETKVKILSPNQAAVQQFLERRRSNPTSEFHNSSLRQTNQGTENAVNRSNGMSNGEEPYSHSPASNIASSTFTNGHTEAFNPLFNMSPIPYTCKNGFENGHASFSRSSEESKTYDRKHSGLDKSGLNMSALSYTFRNDSSMIHTDGTENLPGFSDNLPRLRQASNNCPSGSPRRDVEVVLQASVAYCNNQPALAAAASTMEGLSLTNVTEFSPDVPNSFADCKDRCNRDRKSDATCSSIRFSDEFLTQIKNGVKLKDTSLELKECKEVKSRDHSTEDSELKMVFDKIVRERRVKGRGDGNAHFLPEVVRIDETGDNGHSGVEKLMKRKDPFPKLGSKYHDLLRFCEPEGWGIVVNQCKETAKSMTTNIGDIRRKPSPPLAPKPVKPVVDYSKDDKQEQEQLSSAIENKDGKTDNEKYINENKTEIAQQTDSAEVKNMDSLERNINEIKAETFPRTAMKHYDCNHLEANGTYEKAASYAGDIDRRSVYTETGSLDRYGDAKYHFLHEKGMIKICSPRLELMSESPTAKRKFPSSANRDSHISEEDTNLGGSSSEISGVVIDNEFHLNDYGHRLNDFNDIVDHVEPAAKTNEKPDKQSADNKHINTTIESYNSEMQARQQDLANEILENCLEMIDNNQAALDHVFDWINTDCNNNSDTSIKAELDALIESEAHTQAKSGSENGFQSPIDDSVYYSFQGQSEEIRQVMAELETVDNQSPRIENQELKEFLVAVMNENHEVVEKFLKSGNVIPHAVLKEALSFVIQQQNRALAKELLDYSSEVLHSMDMNDIVDVWPAYTIEDEWNPVFVVLRKSDSDHIWAEFLGYKVYNRKYDSVSKEAEKVVNSTLVRNNPLSFDDIEKLKEAVNEINVQDHSNITLIDVCPCRSRKNGDEIFLETCIVVYCLVKGLIPFNEKPFPKTVLGIPVDVREGYFSLGVRGAPHWQGRRSTDSCTEISDTTETGSTSEGDDSFGSSVKVGSGEDSSAKVGTRSSEDGEECGTEEEEGEKEKNKEESDIAGVFEETDSDRKNAGSDEDTNGGMGARVNIAKDVHGLDDDVDVDYHEGHEEQIVDEQPQNVDLTKDLSTRGLRMGACIHGSDNTNTYTGTLGGFVPINDSHLGFLTCAHVVGPEVGSLVSVVDPGNSMQSNVCGMVAKSVSKPGSPISTGVDVSLVTITDHHPANIGFVSLTEEQLIATGFSKDTSPRFQKGKILTFKELAACWRSKVIKVGATTGITRGSLYSHGLFARRQLYGKAENQSAELYHQLEIIPDVDSAKFFDPGDSGALVFMHLNDQDLYCVGLAVGCTSYGSCVVTPIESVFQELGLPAQFCCS